MSENNWPSRRSVLKGAGSAVAVAGLNTTITAANPSTVGLDSDKGRVENRRRVTFGEDLQRVSDYWMMIAGPSERIYNYIAAAELPKSERSRLKGLYKGIDRRFPVVRQSVGENAIKVALAERAAEPEDAGGNVEKLPEIATAVNNGETTLTDGPDVGPLWNPNLHNDMVGFAAEKVSVSDTYTGKLKNKSWAGDPDNFDREIPDSLKDVLSVDKKSTSERSSSHGVTTGIRVRVQSRTQVFLETSSHRPDKASHTSELKRSSTPQLRHTTVVTKMMRTSTSLTQVITALTVLIHCTQEWNWSRQVTT